MDCPSANYGRHCRHHYAGLCVNPTVGNWTLLFPAFDRSIANYAIAGISAEIIACLMSFQADLRYFYTDLSKGCRVNIIGKSVCGCGFAPHMCLFLHNLSICSPTGAAFSARSLNSHSAQTVNCCIFVNLYLRLPIPQPLLQKYVFVRLYGLSECGDSYVDVSPINSKSWLQKHDRI